MSTANRARARARERARRLMRCNELGQASVLVFQVLMGAARYKRVKNSSCGTWPCRHRSYTNRTQAPRSAFASLEPRKTGLLPRRTRPPTAVLQLANAQHHKNVATAGRCFCQIVAGSRRAPRMPIFRFLAWPVNGARKDSGM